MASNKEDQPEPEFIGDSQLEEAADVSDAQPEPLQLPRSRNASRTNSAAGSRETSPAQPKEAAKATGAKPKLIKPSQSDSALPAEMSTLTLGITPTEKRLTRSRSPTAVPTALLFKLKSQEHRLSALKHLQLIINRTMKDATERIINNWRTTAENLMENFNKEHGILKTQCPAVMLEHEYFVSTMYLFYSIHQDVMLLITQLERTQAVPSSHSSAGTSHAHSVSKLPDIKLPTFGGSYSEWPAFKDLFTSLILNHGQLSDVAKLHYLRSSLIGMPLSCIQGFPLTAESLEPSWRMLVSRFENKRSQLNNQLDQLNDLAVATSKNPGSINTVLSAVSKTRKTLIGILNQEQLIDCMFMYRLARLLDRPTREAWETSLGSTTDIPTFEQMENFLLNRIRALEMVDTQQSTQHKAALTPGQPQAARAVKANIGSLNPPDGQVTHSSRISQRPCSLCNEAHFIVACARFRKLNEEERRKIVVEKRLCYNSLGAHAARNCMSTHKCKTCEGNHHTMIHIAQPSKAASNQQTGANQ